MKKKVLFYLLLSFLIFLAGKAFSQEKLKIQRLTNAIQFDGIPDEAAWQIIDTLSMTMHTPVFQGEAKQRSIIRITYDDQFLWIGAKLLVNDPSHIKASSKKRDELSANSDFFGVILDTYNDNENAMSFFTTPTGLRLDALVSDDASSRMPLNPDWNTFWDVKTSRDQNGWYCEMRIPFSSLRFQTVNGISEMGLISWRWSAHDTENVTFPSIDPKYGMWATWKPSVAKKVLFENIKPSKPVYFSPYVLGGFSNDNSLNTEETAYITEEKFTKEIGGDLKYSISSNLTLDLTVNTDFAQVEADDQQVNLTRFSLFFPEKRMFFQERASIFNFNFGGPNNLFYSRRIGLDEDGNPVRILAGTRLYGRVGKWEMGLLNMQTAKNDAVPSENFGVLRMRRQVINQNSYLGGMLTTRIGTDGNYNTAYGFDGIIRMFGDDYLEFKWAQSFENNVESQIVSLSPARIRLGWERRSQKGLGYDFSFSHSGEDFNPGVGFESRVNYRSIRAQIQWGWLPGEKSKFISYNANMHLYHYFDAITGLTESSSFGPGWQFQTKHFLMGTIQLKRMVENIEEEFSFSDDADVPIGNYEFYGFEGMLVTPMTKKVYAEMMLEGGQFFDGNRFSYTVTPFLNLSSSFLVSGTYQFDAVNFSERNQDFINHIARIKFEYMHSTKLSASSYVQYNTLNAGFVGNFRLRYNPREGNDFYIVFNEIRNLNPDLEIPLLPKLANRTLLLKYTHTFSL
ncbi:MAG: carbohydrate binding family 9 domain-containing protein [Prolixibacteraceae bacterium]|nr:carbohydrate binding family 9 domain-containing protein [Prolixibacteraceae bacterium]MBT7000113.1 carbohydrate binding family 9 domain-containing protein [Prolixibacteraceae bacterium]MBT7395021.1 carbohydrate binding family 9 domain-containing protein [Prolixibacteraceae bacterium]